MEQLTQIDPILRLAQTSKRPVREDVEGSVAKVYRNLGTISARSLQAICGSEWCAEWKPSGSGMTLYVGNGAALPSQPEIHQRGKPNVRGSMIVDCAHAERLVGSTASEFLATPKAHDILLDTDGFRYFRLKEAMSKMKNRYPQRFVNLGVRRAHPGTGFKKTK